MSNTVPSTCLGNIQETTCMRWQGPPYPELNINTGDSLEYVIQQIIANLPSAATDDTSTVDVSCLATSATSDCAANISYRKINIMKTSTTGGVTVMWDGDGISNALPSGYNVSATQVLIRGNDGSVQFTGSVFTAQTAVPLSLFPIILDYTLFIFTPCGNIRLTNSISVDANPGSMTGTLNLIDVPSAASNVIGLQAAVELLAREVCEIKNQL